MSDLRIAPPDFGDALLACQAPLYRYARSLCRDPLAAEELVQETYRRALAAAHKPLPATEDNLRPWLFTILRHLWQNELRSRSRWANSGVTLESLTLSTDGPDVQVSRKLLQYEVRQAIDALPEAFREIILLRDIEGLSYSEITQILGCPSGTVMSRLSRARQILRRLLRVSVEDLGEVPR